MNITNVKYVLDDDSNNCQVISTIDGQQMFVPMNEDNRHWVAIQAWVADGNTIEEAG
tara:strand:+ start:1465 stop:1635 length:171 start_codon:yes stop_codon:yes gene_type:complete